MEDCPRRVRAVVGDRTVIDSDDVVMVHERHGPVGVGRRLVRGVEGRLVDDVAWQYDMEVRREAEAGRGYFAFYDDRTTIEVDGQVLGDSTETGERTGDISAHGRVPLP